MKDQRVEIMAPAGSFAALTAAIDAGADSVYFGVEQLNMRARAANNFVISDLPKIVEQCTNAGIRAYLTVNTILYDHDISLMKRIVDAAKEAGVTAIIGCDIAAIQYAREVGVEIHISTQQNVSNFESVIFFSQFADVVVLARELTLQQIKHIYESIQKENVRGPAGELVKIELFAHGALCVAISGKCHMSLATYNASANRGACLQNCRRSYKVTDEETGVELVLDNKYIMSPKDLCTIGFIDQIVDAGVYVLKLEGRGRSPDYVSTVTRCYKEAVKSYHAGTYTKEKIDAWIKELESVYNRGFWHGGYYLGKQMDTWSGAYGSQATKENIFIGSGRTFFRKTNIGEFIIETGTVAVGDEILVVGPTTGSLKFSISSMFVNEKPADEANKGDVMTITVPNRIRKSDKLFVVKDR